MSLPTQFPPARKSVPIEPPPPSQESGAIEVAQHVLNASAAKTECRPPFWLKTLCIIGAGASEDNKTDYDAYYKKCTDLWLNGCLRKQDSVHP